MIESEIEWEVYQLALMSSMLYNKAPQTSGLK